MFDKTDRKEVKDRYVNEDICNDLERYKYNIYIRLYAKRKTFRNISFQQCIFDNCYLNSCVFDSCDFTGCKFLASNFHQSKFVGCNFEYAIFERSEIDENILITEAPSRENLKIKFARSLRMNFQSLGDAKAVNKAISVELSATAIYLLNSWRSSSHYYRNKYSGFRRIRQFYRWVEFKLLDFVWGNGESITKLFRTIVFLCLLISLYNSIAFLDPWNLRSYIESFIISPAILFGINKPEYYPKIVLVAISFFRLVSMALLISILTKRLGRR